MVTDSLPAIALGTEKVDDDVMKQKPKPKNESIFANGFGLQIGLQGLMFGLLAIVAFRLGENWTHSEVGGQTLAFMVLACSQVIQAFNMRSTKSLFKIGPFTNPRLNMAALFSLIMMAVVLFVPGVMTAFGTIYLPWQLYVIGLVLILLPIPVMEFSKRFGLIHHEKFEEEEPKSRK